MDGSGVGYEDEALHALALYMRQDYQGSHEQIGAIQRKYGGGAIAGCIIVWIDCALNAGGHYAHRAHFAEHHGEVPPIVLRFDNVKTGAKHMSADDVPPEVAWAGRTVAARLAGDEDDTVSFIEVLAGMDVKTLTTYIYAILDVVSAMLREAMNRFGLSWMLGGER